MLRITIFCFSLAIREVNYNQLDNNKIMNVTKILTISLCLIYSIEGVYAAAVAVPTANVPMPLWSLFASGFLLIVISWIKKKR